MEIQAALLCDAATVREGLLHVLGAGITRLWRPDLPATFGLALACVLDVAPEDTGSMHEARVVIFGPEGERVSEATGSFQLPPPPRLEPDEHLVVPLVLPLQGQAQRYGAFTARMVVDDDVMRVVPFWLLHPAEQEIPPNLDVPDE